MFGVFLDVRLFFCGDARCRPLALQAQFFQPPSVCVTAAGITQDDFLLNMKEEEFDRVVQVNLKVLGDLR